MSNSRSNPIRWWDAASALLLMAAMLISASRLVATDWTGHLSIVQTLAFFGVIAGLLLGLSSFSPRTTVIFAFIYGLFAIPWQLGLTLPAAYSWSERIIILMNRLQIILSQLANREPVSDSLLFLIIFFLLFWVIAVFSSYILVRRGDPWLAILPGGLALFIIHSFDSAVADRVWYLAAYLFFALILVARMTFNHRQSRWREIRTTLPPHISLDFVRYTIFIVFVIVILAWTAPAMANALPEARRAWRPVQDAWNETINNFENAFASLKATIFSYTTVYSSTSTLGRGAQLSDNQIFHAFAPITTPPEVRLYWRARVFDSYQNGLWRTTMENSQPFDPATGEMPVETGVQRWQAQYYIFSAANLTTLFMPSQPLWISRAGELEYGENPDGTIDFVTFLADAPVGPGERYDVLTSVSAAPVALLRQSGSDYPAWIRERYLQLPDTITPRTIALAEQITAGLETPYDKAAAITRYLRENIRYVPFLAEAPPARAEPIDWFLFESKSGFCNYYASAQVILLRSLGIPARYSVGFAQGEQIVEDEDKNPPDVKVFIVRQRDSHAWPEVYFPDLGWVEFEPTASQPDIARQNINASAGMSNLTEAQELEALREDKRSQMELLRNQAAQSTSASTRPSLLRQVTRFALLAAGIALLAYSLRFLPLLGLPAAPTILESLFVRLGIKTPAPVKRWILRLQAAPAPKPIRLPALPLLIERWILKLGLQPPQFIQRWARRSELPPLSQAYLEINRGLNLSGSPPMLTDTPSERAESLGRILPPADAPARELVRQYQIGTFSERPVDLGLAQRSARDIRMLSWKAFLKNSLKRIQKPDRPDWLVQSDLKRTRSNS